MQKWSLKPLLTDRIPDGINHNRVVSHSMHVLVYWTIETKSIARSCTETEEDQESIVMLCNN